MSCSTSMGEFLEEFNYLRHSFPFLELEQNFEPLSQLTEFTGSVMQNQCKGLMDYSNSHYLPHQEFAVSVIDNSASFLPPVECQKPILKQQPVVGSIGEHIHEDRKRKLMVALDTNSELGSEIFSEVGLAEIKAKKMNGSGSGKRHKRNSKEKNKQKEVVHVRARRGQATDSHSLAERERRKKINERMRRLQDHVPGCNKTMGMAKILDEIISYVQSLQNQVEFLSMELSAASHFQDYNIGAGSLSTVQVEKEDGAREPEKLKGVMEGHGDCTSFHSSVPF